MSKQRVKDELEQDILLDTFSKAQSFYDKNKSLVIGGIIALVVVIGGSVGYYYYSTAQENQAQNLMGSATQLYMNGDYEKALTGSEVDFSVGFEQIIDNYSITNAANLARYYAAVCEYKLGNTQQALTYIQEYDIPDGIMGVGPLSFYGVLHTELGNHSQAAQKYVEAAEWDKNDSTTPYNYLEAAKAFYDADNQAEAQKYAQLIVDQYANSQQSTDAQKLLGMIAVAQ